METEGGGTHLLPVHETLLSDEFELGDIKQHYVIACNSSGPTYVK